MDEHEEEFYFTEVEVTLDTVMQTFADMYTSTSPSSSAFPYDSSTNVQCNQEEVLQRGPSWPPSDHDYQRKVYIHSAKILADSKYGQIRFNSDWKCVFFNSNFKICLNQVWVI